MWTAEHRRAANRSGLRYPSDLTDAEWALVEPMIPPARRAQALGECARGFERDFLRAVDRLPVEGAASHPDWLRDGVPAVSGATIYPVLVTPAKKERAR